MKEQEKNEIKLLSDKLDALNRKEPQLLESGDVEKLGALLKEKEALVIEIERLRGQRVEKLSAKAQKLQKWASAAKLPRKSRQIWAR